MISKSLRNADLDNARHRVSRLPKVHEGGGRPNPRDNILRRPFPQQQSARPNKSVSETCAGRTRTRQTLADGVVVYARARLPAKAIVSTQSRPHKHCNVVYVFCQPQQVSRRINGKYIKNRTRFTHEVALFYRTAFVVCDRLFVAHLVETVVLFPSRER